MSALRPLLRAPLTASVAVGCLGVHAAAEYLRSELNARG